MPHPVDFDRRQAGFTLVEALVSLALVGMAGVLVVAGLGGVQQVWTRAHSHSRGVEAVETAQTRLRSRLEQTVPATRYDGGPHTDFDGQSATMTFIAPPGESFGPGGPRRYTLSLSAAGQLLLSSLPDGNANAAAGRRDEPLLAGVQSLDLAYWNGGTHAWSNVWHAHPAPPQLVRIRLRFPPNDRRWWPDLVIRLRADLDTDCLIEGSGEKCRGR